MHAICHRRDPLARTRQEASLGAGGHSPSCAGGVSAAVGSRNVTRRGLGTDAGQD